MQMPKKIRQEMNKQAFDRLLGQIHTEFFPEMVKQTRGTPVMPELFAAMMPNEAGKFWDGPRKGQINFDATRLEKHVLSALKAVRDGRQAKYGRVRANHLKGASDAALENLARSWGGLQTMGYYVSVLFTDTDGTPVTIAELRDVTRHFRYATQLIIADEASQDEIEALNEGVEQDNDQKILWALNRIARRWNTGSPTGTPYNGQVYVDTLIYCFYRWKELFGFTGKEEQPNVEVLATTVNNPQEDLPPATDDGESSQRPALPAVSETQAEKPEPIVEKWWTFSKSIPAKLYGAITVVLGGGAASIGEYLKVWNENRSTILWVSLMVGIFCVGGYLMHSRRKKESETQKQLFEMQKLLAEIAADPNRKTVGFKEEVTLPK